MLICLTTCQGLSHRQGHQDSDLARQIPNGLWGSRQPVTPTCASSNGISGAQGLAFSVQASLSQGVSYSHHRYEEEAGAVALIVSG